MISNKLRFLLNEDKINRISAVDMQNSELIGKLSDGTSVWVVDGEYIRNNIKVEWIGGGHCYQDKFIADKEIWVERQLNEEDTRMLFVHEASEYILMKNGKSYNISHEMANSIEKIARGNNN